MFGSLVFSLSCITGLITVIRKVFYELSYGIIRGSAIGFFSKGIFSLALSLVNSKNFRLKHSINLAFGWDNLRFSIFLASFTGCFRAIVTLMTFITHEDKPSNSLIAAAISSLTMLLDERSRRKSLTLYFFARSLDTLANVCVHKGILPQIDWFYSFLFGVVNMPIQYGFVFMPEILDKGYYKWILNMGDVHDSAIVKTIRDRRSMHFDHGISIPFRSCNEGGLHEGSCTWFSFLDLISCFFRASKTYIPVHLATLIFFRHAFLLDKPGIYIKKTALAILRSCMFLSTYTFTIKFTICVLRNIRHRDSGWHALLAGILTGLSTFFENRSRISELTIYCMPRGLEGAWAYLSLNGLVRDVANFDVALLSFAMAVLCSARKDAFRKSNFRSLCFILGS